MRSTLYTLAFAITLAACGGDSTQHTTVDAPTAPHVDAPTTPGVDAPVTAAAMGLGKVCGDATHTCPATGATLCAKLSSTSALGFCTLSCGSSPTPTPPAMPTPPAGGDAICTGSTPAPGAGSPACVLTGTAAAGQTPWACGIECGTAGTMNLGSCPMGLTCTSNLCQ